MFNEREALRLRLEQLGDAEIQVMRELRKEREGIYSKPRELIGRVSLQLTKNLH